MMGKDENLTEDNKIIRGDDGVYRWIYEVNLLKNPVILLLVWKILAISLGGVWVFVTLLSLGDREFWWKGFWSETKVFLLILAGILVLGIIAYLLYAAVMGGKYCVLFEMDERGIKHTQLPKQFNKTKALSTMTVLLGLASGKPGVVGSGLLAGSKQSMFSEWSKVKSVICYSKRNTIKLNSPFNKNQVYASPNDFEFVKHFIEEHCVNAGR